MFTLKNALRSSSLISYCAQRVEYVIGRQTCSAELKKDAGSVYAPSSSAYTLSTPKGGMEGGNPNAGQMIRAARPHSTPMAMTWGRPLVPRTLIPLMAATRSKVGGS